MGWTSLNREPGMSDRDFFAREFHLGPNERQDIVACGSANFTWYAAIRDNDTGKVWGLVVLTRRSKGYHNFTYKDMSESVGPTEAKAPKKVLDALSPTDEEYALQWRASCRAFHESQATARTVKAGTVVRFAQPLEFTDGRTFDTFRFESGSVFQPVAGYGRVRITRWRQRAFEVVT